MFCKFVNILHKMNIAVIKGDIIASRTLPSQEAWMVPLKTLFNSWGTTPQDWEIVWGDSFQIEFNNPYLVLERAIQIKSLIKTTSRENTGSKSSLVDVRMAIGIGTKDYAGERVLENNGTAFVHAGDKFATLKKENLNLAIKSPWTTFDEDMNLYLRLIGNFMDNWTISSAALMLTILQNQGKTQEEIGNLLGIKQSGVSGRWKRAHIEEIMEVMEMYSKKLKNCQS